MKSVAFILISLILLSHPVYADNSQLSSRITVVSISSLEEVNQDDSTFFDMKLSITAEMYNDGEEFSYGYPNTCTHHVTGSFYLNEVQNQTNERGPAIACGDAITSATHTSGLDIVTDTVTLFLDYPTVTDISDLDGLLVLRYYCAAPIDQQYETLVTITDGQIDEISVNDSDIGWTEEVTSTGPLSLSFPIFSFLFLAAVIVRKRY